MEFVFLGLASMAVLIAFRFGYHEGSRITRKQADIEHQQTILAFTDSKGLPERIVEKRVEVPVEKIVYRDRPPIECGIGGCDGRAKVPELVAALAKKA